MCVHVPDVTECSGTRGRERGWGRRGMRKMNEVDAGSDRATQAAVRRDADEKEGIVGERENIQEHCKVVVEEEVYSSTL